jgi:exonuclease III
MGYDTPSKLLGFMKIIEKHKPDIIMLQEAANTLVNLRGYSAHIASGAICGNYHGALIYISTERGQWERISEKRADTVHLYSAHLDPHVFNTYVPPIHRLYGPMYKRAIDEVLLNNKVLNTRRPTR